MRMLALARRNALELLRDPLTLLFGLGFPLVLLALLSLIAQRAPVEIFHIEQLAPGAAVFGYSFLALFAALLISKDRSSALMLRLLASPLTAADFILGYCLPLLPLALVQAASCMGAGLLLGMQWSRNVPLTVLALFPAAIVYIALGLIFGSLLNDRQVGGVCGALLTNLSAWLSGIWFAPELVGKGFAAVARALPFANMVDAARSALAGRPDGAALLVTALYALALSALAIWVFSRRMRRA